MRDYDERRKQQREEERRYQGDVSYDVWRFGGNPDRVDRDRVRDRFWDGVSVESTVHRELESQRPKPQEPSEEEYREDEQCGQEPEEPPATPPPVGTPPTLGAP